MLNSRHGPSVVEGSLLVRADKKEDTTSFKHPLPLMQRLQRIGDVLYRVRGNDKIVLLTCNSAQVGCLTYELHSHLVLGVMERAPLASNLPLEHGDAGEIAVVNAPSYSVDWQDGSP